MERDHFAVKVASAIVLFGFALVSVATAQETLNATQDPDQHQQWGLWRTMNSKYPRIQTRAKCSYDVKIDGKWTSWWNFEIRSTYQVTTDYIFLIEYGDFGKNANTFGAPGLIIAKYEDVYQNGTELLGTCHQHPLPNALSIRITCAAPTGQDLPCFNDENGSRYTDAAPSGSRTRPSTPQAETTGESSGSYHYGICWARGQSFDDIYYTSIFHTSGVTDDNEAAYDWDVRDKWMAYWKSLYGQRVPNGGAGMCVASFKTTADAEAWRKSQPVKASETLVNWSPNQ